MTSAQGLPAPPATNTPSLFSLPCSPAVRSPWCWGCTPSCTSPPGSRSTSRGFSSPLYAKAWLTTAAAVLAVVQLGTALPDRPASRPAWMATVHRWSGRIAILLTVPVIIHCVFALGFQTSSARVLAHSVLGCFFYGAFVAKMLSLSIARRATMPKWVFPVLGGVVFLSLIAAVGDLGTMAVRHQGSALLIILRDVRVRLSITKGEAPWNR